MAKMENCVRVQIDRMMQCLHPETSSLPKIFQVPTYFRKLKEEAYEPKLISIGPYHRQKHHLEAMEALKVRFLKDLLQRRNENSAQRYVEVMTSMMGRARKCYSESIVIPDDEFLKMMVLDGCFIVELLHKIDYGSCPQDSTLHVRQIFNNILNDLSLVENQLPLFVLWELFGVINEHSRESIFAILLWKIFGRALPGFRVCEIVNENSIKNAKHLVDLFRTAWLPSVMREYKEVTDARWCFIPSATELREAVGIKFKKAWGGSLFDVKFVNGKLYIPVLRIEDRTARLFRNIIACEQFDNSESPKYLCEYALLMDCLINTEKDVELFCHAGIIDNWLGTDEAVAEMFNTLGTEVIFSSRNFFYAKLFNDVNRYYNTPGNRKMDCLRHNYLESFRHNYFNTPWALIAFLAAAFLLLLTLLQTIFTIFPRS